MRAVDDAAVAHVRDRRSTRSRPTSRPTRSPPSFGAVFERVIGGDPVMRAYLRRALLQDKPASTTLLDEMLAVTRAGLDDARRGRRSPPDERRPQWRPYQVLFIALGSMLLEPLLQRELDGHTFDPDVVRQPQRRANLDFFTHGLAAAP